MQPNNEQSQPTEASQAAPVQGGDQPSQPAPPATPAQAPVMDVVPPANDSPVAQPPVQDAPADTKDNKQPNPEAGKQPKPHKQPKGNGVGLAIVAAVVIVLGLACLAVYAYLKTHK